jgi:hypothetical protein
MDAAAWDETCRFVHLNSWRSFWAPIGNILFQLITHIWNVSEHVLLWTFFLV